MYSFDEEALCRLLKETIECYNELRYVGQDPEPLATAINQMLYELDEEAEMAEAGTVYE
jgi:hypothetical protein